MIKKSLVINGVQRILIVEPHETLAMVLREHLQLTGCKIGCGEGHCGVLGNHLAEDHVQVGDQNQSDAEGEHVHDCVGQADQVQGHLQHVV